MVRQRGGSSGISTDGIGLGAGLIGIFGSTTRNSCPSDDTSLFCQISRILAIIGSLLSIIMTIVILYVFLRSLGLFRTTHSPGRRR